MKILIVDPYLTPSHQSWLNGICNHLPHEVKTITLPPYHWKWRMHGGSVLLAHQLIDSDFRPDVIIATDMLDLNVFLAHSRKMIREDTRCILYFHENQVTYPVSSEDLDRQHRYDNHYGFINYTSALLADRVIFNSSYHQRSFLEALPGFLNQFPDHSLVETVSAIKNKSSLIYPGFDAQRMGKNRIVRAPDKLPSILWNHRWEYDKDPDMFFRVLSKMDQEALPFNLIVVGQSFQRTPSIFATARQALERHIIHWGHVEDEDTYYQWLWKADIVISTSNQDFFGISVVEAIFAHCYPLLPHRLAFPEHIPADLHHRHLYSSEKILEDKLRNLLKEWPQQQQNLTLAHYMRRYDHANLAHNYRVLLDELS